VYNCENASVRDHRAATQGYRQQIGPEATSFGPEGPDSLILELGAHQGLLFVRPGRCK
jgi:hypothetical protein